YATAGPFTITTTINHEGILTIVQSSAGVGTGVPVGPNQTKPTNWWSGVLGQELIRQFGLTSGGLTLGQWLATNFPNLYGGGNGAPNLTNLTNAQVATFYLGLFNQPNTLHVGAEVLDTALDIFATTLSLGGTIGQSYGFKVDTLGVGAATWNIFSSGQAFGVPNNSNLTVLQIMQAANNFAVSGNPWDSNGFLRNLAYNVFRGINGEGGPI
ncbi:MAG TPA: hypothetical protein VKU02_30700, partial [Gemmataceae bacterium]|nr:hypothetical protein [Gemmataceae bacterium]